MTEVEGAGVHYLDRLGPVLINAHDAARLLAIGARKLWELTNRRDIPSVRIGRAVRYDVRDLEDWIESHKSKRLDADA